MTALGGDRRTDLAGGPEGSPRRQRGFTYYLAEAAMGLEGLVLLWIAGVPLRGLVTFAKPGESLALGLAGGLVTLAVAVLLTRLLPPGQERAEAAAFARWLAGLRPLELALFMLVTAAGEELLFRGAVQTIAFEFVASVPLGIAISTLVFTAFHLRSSAAGILTGLASGTVLGLLFWATGSLWAPILAHALHNTGFVAVHARSAGKGGEAGAADGTGSDG